MPFYFCCRCHDLITRDAGTDPNAVVCDKCAQTLESSVKDGVKKDQNENKDSANLKICPISDWK